MSLKKLAITIGPNQLEFEGLFTLEEVRADLDRWFAFVTQDEDGLAVQLKAGREALAVAIEANKQAR